MKLIFWTIAFFAQSWYLDKQKEIRENLWTTKSISWTSRRWDEHHSQMVVDSISVKNLLFSDSRDRKDHTLAPMPGTHGQWHWCPGRWLYKAWIGARKSWAVCWRPDFLIVFAETAPRLLNCLPEFSVLSPVIFFFHRNNTWISLAYN